LIIPKQQYSVQKIGLMKKINSVCAPHFNAKTYICTNLDENPIILIQTFLPAVGLPSFKKTGAVIQKQGVRAGLKPATQTSHGSIHSCRPRSGMPASAAPVPGSDDSPLLSSGMPVSAAPAPCSDVCPLLHPMQ